MLIAQITGLSSDVAVTRERLFTRILLFRVIQVQQRYHSSGCYEEVTEVPALAGLAGSGHQQTRKVRHCNWVRFLRTSPLFTPLVNVVCSKIKGNYYHLVLLFFPSPCFFLLFSFVCRS